MKSLCEKPGQRCAAEVDIYSDARLTMYYLTVACVKVTINITSTTSLAALRCRGRYLLRRPADDVLFDGCVCESHNKYYLHNQPRALPVKSTCRKHVKDQIEKQTQLEEQTQIILDSFALPVKSPCRKHVKALLICIIKRARSQMKDCGASCLEKPVSETR